MATCQAVQRNLTAWVDGALPAKREDQIRQHVTTCARCRAEAESIRAAVEAQQRTLSRAISVGDVDPELLWMRLQRTRASSAATNAQRWWSAPWGWAFRPVAVLGAALTVAAIVLFWVGGPAEVLIPLGVESPPVAVSRQPEMFTDYPLIQHLDALEHFDTVESVPLDDDQASQRG